MRDKLGKFIKGTIQEFSKETRIKLSNAKKGCKLSEEHKRKIGLSHEGSKSYNWKGGRAKASSGYILIHKPEHPFCNMNKYVPEHRLIMEKHIGRFLKPEEQVHHINGVRDDNCIENLKLFSSCSLHTKFHFPDGYNSIFKLPTNTPV